MNPAMTFPESARAWRRLVHNLKSVISFRLLMLATRIAPDEEGVSMTVAAYQHVLRTIKMDVWRKASAPGGPGPIKGEDA